MENQHNNPLLKPFVLPPFRDIKDSDFEPAMIAGIKAAEKDVNEITANASVPDFDNTIAALDKSGEMLDRVESVFFNLQGAMSNDTLEELAQKFAPMLAQHHNNVMLDDKLFERVKYVWEHSPENLTTEQHTLLENTYKAFVRNGALLDENGKAELRRISEEFSKKTVGFATNLLHARNDFHLNVTDASKVEGVPASALGTARETAVENGHEGWDITLDQPVYGPFITYSPDRELRKTLYMARNAACMDNSKYSNLKICEDIVNLRLRSAKLLGYDCYADFVLEKRMAENKDNVYKLLHELTAAYLPQAREEVKAVADFARKSEGKDFVLQPWDFAYYSRKLKLSLFDIDSEMLRPYFELSKVAEGVFGLANQLYGVTFSVNKDAPVYADDVVAYNVNDADGSFLGTLYMDYFPRKGKQGGAWTTSYSPQYKESDKNVRPVVAVVMNLTKPTADRPSLLTLGEVTTFLHEFGHSLHGLFANTTYRSLSGTNVYWDFVELPSQFMENFALEKKFLSKFAIHYKTGEPLPDELMQKVVNSRNYNVAYATIRQVSFGLLDMGLHCITSPIQGCLMEKEHAATDEVSLMPEPSGTGTAVHFSHIMDGGYAAGYYSYKWAEVLDADAFKAFKEKGVFSKEMAARFRDCILSRGGTEPPMNLYERFRGKKPTIDAMMERDGIKVAR